MSTPDTKAAQLRPFSLLIKPASADCNLRCDYCFYLDHVSLYPETRTHRMSDEVLEQMIRSYMSTTQPTYSFGWQGGEPTLMKLEFFEKVVKLQKRYGSSGAVVSNGLQTNATLIDDAFAAHLAEYQFLVGASIDGPPELHDVYRKDAAGNGSHERVMKGVEALNRNKVEYNALVLVSSANVEHPETVYRYLTDLGINYHQYIPCVEFDEDGNPLPYTITGDQWGQFLNGIFNVWRERDTRTVSIRDFDAILGVMVNGSYTMCVQSGNCTSYFVVEYNGDIYPCDFFVEKGTKLGNVAHTSWRQAQQSSRYNKFGRQKSEWNHVCAECEYLRYCSGDCLKQRFYGSRDPGQISWLCRGWKRFYQHTLPEFEKLAVAFMNERQATQAQHLRKPITQIQRPKIGWNDPCFCGSGKKYRLCHGKAASRR